MRTYLILLVSLITLLSSCSKNKELERDKELIANYISDNNITGTITTETGLTYKITKEGTGDQPTSSSNVKVNYKGYLLNGSVFDQSSSPVTLNLQQVIQGWKEGLTKFKEGGSGMLFIPSDYGYGNQAQADIPAGSVLIFEIDLIEVL
jgi:FKBP-type peptidyl-prolyl cis-trans isomerase FkpA